jgi:hypothetical protein
MSTFRRITPSFSACVLIVALAVTVDAQPASKDRAQPTEKEAAEALLKAERALKDAKEQFRKGGLSALELDLTTITVNEARLVVAVLRDRDDEIVPNLKEIVAARERIMTRMNQQKGPLGETAANMDIASRLLAEARLRLAKAQGTHQEALKQLEEIVMIARREFLRTEKLVSSRSATQQELDAAQKVLNDARKRLAELKGM